MNLPTVQKAQLPAHLQHLQSNAALMAVNTFASEGITEGGHPRISIQGSRFRLQSPQNEEFVVPQLHLDVIVIDANPNKKLSKVFFAKKYDPKAEETGPDCFSDNGIGPSVQSSAPQCATCAACPNNVIGSRISDAGSPTKACGDYKKIAVLLANDTSGQVFGLRLPYMSLSNWRGYIEALDKNGVPASSVITRMTFDTAVSYPKLTFKPAFDKEGQMPYINEQQAADVMDVIGTEEVDVCTGKNDRAIAADKAPRLAPATPTERPEVTPPVAAAPAPLPQTLQQFNSPPNSPPQGIATAEKSAGAPPAETGVEGPTSAKRTRRSKPAEFVPAAAQPAQASVNFDAPPPFVRNSAEVTAPLKPQGVTNAALDDAIAAAMNV